MGWYDLVRFLVQRAVPGQIEYEDEDMSPVTDRVRKSFYFIHKETFGSKFVRFLLRRKTIIDGKVLSSQRGNYISLTESGKIIEDRLRRRLPIEMGSDDSLHQFLLNSGSFLLKPSMSNDKWILDMTEYEKYEVRDGFETYGGCVTLDTKGIISILYKGSLYNDKDSRFESLLNIVRSTLFVKIAIEMHAIRVHLATAQQFALWVRSRYSRNVPGSKFVDGLSGENLDRTEAQSRLLKMFTFNVLKVNSSIPLLLEPQGIAHRLTAFTETGYMQFCKAAYSKGQFRRNDLVGFPGTAWFDSIGYFFEHCEKLIKSFFVVQDLRRDEDMNYGDLVDAIVTSTIVHNIVGDDLVYAMSVSGFIPPKLHSQDHSLIARSDNVLLQSLLIAITTRIPLVSDNVFRSVFSGIDGKYQRAWDKFVGDVNDEFKDVKWMDINKVEISVGY